MASPPVGSSASRYSQMLAEPPVARTSTNTAALIAISTCEVSAGFAERFPPYAVRPARVVFAPSLTHVGHWKPTAAWRMQSGQIGRLQRWHRMCASRPLCR
jgi:hypothetical protein